MIDFKPVAGGLDQAVTGPAVGSWAEEGAGVEKNQTLARQLVRLMGVPINDEGRLKPTTAGG